MWDLWGVAEAGVVSSINIGIDNYEGLCYIGYYPLLIISGADVLTLVHEVGHAKGIIGDYNHIGFIMHSAAGPADCTRVTQDECNCYGS